MSHDPGESQGSDPNMALSQEREGDAVDDRPPVEAAIISTTPTTPVDGFGSEVDSQEEELLDYNDLVVNQTAPGMEQSP